MQQQYERNGRDVRGNKTQEGPATAIEFLGLQLDLVAREIRLPRPKLEKLRAKLAELRHARRESFSCLLVACPTPVRLSNQVGNFFAASSNWQAQLESQTTLPS